MALIFRRLLKIKNAMIYFPKILQTYVYFLRHDKANVGADVPPVAIIVVWVNMDFQGFNSLLVLGEFTVNVVSDLETQIFDIPVLTAMSRGHDPVLKFKENFGRFVL